MLKKDFINIINEQSNDYKYQQERKKYLAWKRKNVTLRGVQDVYAEDNGGMARFGRGLYTAYLSNMQMAKKYGTVYYLVGAIPKNPKVFNTANDAEIWIQNNIYVPFLKNFTKSNNIDYEYNPNLFFEHTTIEKEMLNLGYDGLAIKGREMVNYKPDKDKIIWFQNERQLENYYETLVRLNEI